MPAAGTCRASALPAWQPCTVACIGSCHPHHQGSIAMQSCEVRQGNAKEARKYRLFPDHVKLLRWGFQRHQRALEAQFPLVSSGNWVSKPLSSFEKISTLGLILPLEGETPGLLISAVS